MKYYQDVLDQITAHMQASKYEDALFLLKQELQMPYVPKEFEQPFQQLHLECIQELRNAKKKYDLEDVEHLLGASMDEAYMACELLRQSNVRQHLEVIQSYLSNQPNPFIRSVLLDLLQEQGIQDEIEMNYDDLDICVVPAYLEPLDQQDALQSMVKTLNQYFESNNPTMLQMCIESLLLEAHLKRPFHFSEDEINYVLHALLTYVFKANGLEDELDGLLEEKRLAMYSGYDLLLDKYCI